MKLPSAVVAALLLAPPGAAAQDPAPAAAGQDAAPQVDVIDVWHKLRDEQPKPEIGQDTQGRMIAAMPIIGWNPTFGMTFGAAAQIAFVAGDPATTRFSSSVSSLSYSTNNDLLLNVRFGLHTSENHWFVEGDNRVYVSGQSVYGLGPIRRPVAPSMPTTPSSASTTGRIAACAVRSISGPACCSIRMRTSNRLTMWARRGPGRRT